MRARRRILAALAIAGALAVAIAGVAISASIFEQPSEGQQFQYVGTAFDDTDPDQEQPGVDDNDVAHFDTRGEAPVQLRRNVGEQVWELDNQLAFKYFFADRTCGAGSPRVQLAVDENGDGAPDGNLHGHVRPPHQACPSDKWIYEDLTDDERRWEIGAGLTGARAFPFYTWTEVEELLGPALVLEGALIEDAHAFAPQNKGDAYYDLVTIGNRTFEDHNDTSRRE